ncbi:hypothetical protein [Candidatus Tisiphia endosymbiont of Nemotelus uliginosus]|uniref:hypothetical protein n=1 Tax=Candidatus Tisiphia endosymbiont of Nemotelus uliginosus TaxID=3077926 RepID=UPI0035C89AE7
MSEEEKRNHEAFGTKEEEAEAQISDISQPRKNLSASISTGPSISSIPTTSSISSDNSSTVETKSWFSRGIDNIKNSYIGQKTAPLFSKIAAARKWAANTKVGKAVRSKAFLIPASVAFTIIGLSGVTGPASPLLVGLGATGLGLMAASSIMQVRKTRKHRHLAKEAGLLIENRRALMQQQELLEKHPELKEILKDSLYVSNHEQKQSQPISSKTILASHAAQNIVEFIPELLEAISSTVHAMHNPIVGLPLAISAGKTIYSAIEGVHDTTKSTEMIKSLHEYINEEKSKQDVGHYKNVKELRDMTTRNAIQAQAIQSLVEEHEDYPKLTPQQKQQQFKINCTAFAELLNTKEYQKADDKTKEDLLTKEIKLQSHYSNIYGSSMTSTPKELPIQPQPSNFARNFGQDVKATFADPFTDPVIKKKLLQNIDQMRRAPHPNIHLDSSSINRSQSTPNEVPQAPRKRSEQHANTL